MSKVNVEKVADEHDRSLPVFEEFEKIAEKIRLKAWSLFSGRGSQPGNELEDWLAAEREICWPTAELAERDEVYTIRIALAGFKSDEIDVTATPHEVLVRAEHRSDASGQEDDGVKWSEFRSNSVFRRIPFPERAEIDEIKASFRNGMLRIRAPKHLAPEEAAEKIEFNAPS
jgi:HSP20 family protein